MGFACYARRMDMKDACILLEEQWGEIEIMSEYSVLMDKETVQLNIKITLD